MSARSCLVVLTPSLRISGGNKETVRLVQEVAAGMDIDIIIVSMWRHDHEVDTGAFKVVYLCDAAPVASRALGQLPSIALAFLRLMRELRRDRDKNVRLLLTHYSTYPLSWILPSLPRVCFTQDMEWLFFPAGWRRTLLKRAILYTNRRALVITTNAFVTDKL